METSVATKKMAINMINLDFMLYTASPNAYNGSYYALLIPIGA